MLTNDELQAIRARCEAATPGPWTHRAREGGWDAVYEEQGSYAPIFHAVLNAPANSTFAATARTDIPALLAHIDRQRRALEWLAKKTAHACATAVGCPFTEPCPAEDTRCLDIEAEDWLKISLNATKETVSEQDK